MHSSARLLSGLIFATAILLAVPVSAEAAGMIPDNLVPLGTAVGTIDIPTNLTVDEVRDIVAYSLAARSWTLKEKSDQRVVGYLNHRGHEATLTFLLKPGVMELYCEGFRVSKSGERQKPAIPEGWIANLKKDIPKRMAMEVAKK
jgi:hypothetical protein